ncbi:MAG: hypothetical protein ACE5KD_03255 [Candidatus Bathyarchaeia archaeon]
MPQTVKPCGFYGDTLTEPTWLPNKDRNCEVQLRPSVMMAKKSEDYKIVDFWSHDHNIKDNSI